MQNVMSVMSPLTLAYGEGAWPPEAGTNWPRRSLALGQEHPGLAGCSMLCQKMDTGAKRQQRTLPSSFPGPGPFTCPPHQKAEWRMVIKDGKTGLTLGHVVRGKQVWRGQRQPFQLARDREPRERAPGVVDAVLADSCFSGAPLISILSRHYEHPDTFRIRCLHAGLEKHTQNRVLIS